MYNIFDLKEMELEQLHALGQELEIKGFKKMKKDSAITEDEMARLEKDVQKSLDDAIALIDKNSDAKEKEIMEV